MNISVAVHYKAFIDALVIEVDFGYCERVVSDLMPTVFEHFSLVPEPNFLDIVFTFCFALELNSTADICLEVLMTVYQVNRLTGICTITMSF